MSDPSESQPAAAKRKPRRIFGIGAILLGVPIILWIGAAFFVARSLDVPGIHPARRAGRFRTACPGVPARLDNRHRHRAGRRARAAGLRRGRRGRLPASPGQRGRMVLPGQAARSGGDPAGRGIAGNGDDSVRQVSARRRLHRGRELQRQQSQLRNQLGNAEAQIRAGDGAYVDRRRLHENCSVGNRSKAPPARSWRRPSSRSSPRSSPTVRTPTSSSFSCAARRCRS